MTLASDFGSAFAWAFGGLATVVVSVFLFVTGAFSFSEAGFTAALDEGLALDDGTVFTGFATALAADFVAALLGVFALLAGWAATEFLTAGFAIDLPEAGLVAADFEFFASGVVFAVFFIAFAMGSIPTGLLSLRNKSAYAEPMNTFVLQPAW
ncbi:hypothetical protein [Noviherbaspirillum sp.]|uniref:hypothetical protein n=1 Tax=Noviherbaspirillum sp. TaxID=1926288 RepID=UPI002FE0C5F2